MVPIFLHSRRFTPTHRGACAHVRGSTELPGGPREPARRRAARGAHRAWEMDREALASGDGVVVVRGTIFGLCSELVENLQDK